MNYCTQEPISDADEQWLAIKGYEGINWAIENQNRELQLISGKDSKLRSRSLWLSANLSNSKLSNSIIQSTSLLTVEQVREIKVLLQERKLSIKEIAELYDVSK